MGEELTAEDFDLHTGKPGVTYVLEEDATGERHRATARRGSAILRNTEGECFSEGAYTNLGRADELDDAE